MRVLFVGGTGIISTACTDLAVRCGIEVVHLNRGRTAAPVPAGVESIRADVREEDEVRKALGNREFDAVVNWIAFTLDHVEQDIRVFSGRTKQYVFIGTASSYQKPPRHYLITEDTPLENPYWEYSRVKASCERRLMEEKARSGFPVVIVRPSYTYGDTKIPMIFGFGGKSYTIVRRMRRGKKTIIPGDGTSLWQMTHSTDFAKGFVGLLGDPRTIGEAFHITSDEVLNWNQIFEAIAAAAGARLNPVHIASDLLVAWRPGQEGTLLGDKSNSVVLDNSKIKKFVPDFRATVSFQEGVRRTVAWHEADPSRMEIDEEGDAAHDRFIAAYEEMAARVRAK